MQGGGLIENKKIYHPYQFLGIGSIINFVVMYNMGWAPAGTIISGIVLLIIVYPLIREWRRRRKPFNIRHTLDLADSDIVKGRAYYAEGNNPSHKDNASWLSSEKALLLERNKPNIVELEFKPRVRRHITRVALRFIPDTNSAPAIDRFMDVNPEAWEIGGYREFPVVRDRAISYLPPFYTSTKKAARYLVTFVPNHLWAGELSIIIQMEEQDEYIKRIPCEVKTPNEN